MYSVFCFSRRVLQEGQDCQYAVSALPRCNEKQSVTKFSPRIGSVLYRLLLSVKARTGKMTYRYMLSAII